MLPDQTRQLGWTSLYDQVNWQVWYYLERKNQFVLVYYVFEEILSILGTSMEIPSPHHHQIRTTKFTLFGLAPFG